MRADMRRAQWATVARRLLVTTAVGVPVCLVLGAVVLCGYGSCYGSGWAGPVVTGYVVLVAGAIGTAWFASLAGPEVQRGIGMALLVSALPYGLLTLGIAYSALGGGDGDYLMMTALAFVFGAAVIVTLLVAGGGLAVAGTVRRHRTAP